jgi:hypothetical protein
MRGKEKQLSRKNRCRIASLACQAVAIHENSHVLSLFRIRNKVVIEYNGYPLS